MPYLYGVDITLSAYLDRPVPLAAAALAAKAHAGQFRKSGEPYVQHCIATALLTELMVLHYDTEEWSNRKCASLAQPPCPLGSIRPSRRAVHCSIVLRLQPTQLCQGGLQLHRGRQR